MASSALQELVSMGYSESNATRALQVAGGDMEQAVGYLLLGEQSQSHLADTLIHGSLTHLSHDSSHVDAVPLASAASSAAADTPDFTGDSPYNDKVKEFLKMGYNRQSALHALSVAGGDVDQAVNFLLMGDSRTGFVLDQQHSSFRLEDDAVMAAILQEEELDFGTAHAAIAAQAYALHGAPQATAAAPDSAMYHATSMRVRNNDAPRMVASKSALTTPGAEPFCACIAASRFLSGGVVTADFLNEIMEGGIELFRKGNGSFYNVSKVIQKYGRSSLYLEHAAGEREPKECIFMADDLQHPMGIRKQLASCRNEQPAGWQLIILEIPSFDAICIALPPKGTKNKFWYFDFYARSCFRVPGAYARVHSTLLQLAESLEAIFKAMLHNMDKDFQTFHLFRLERIRR